MAAAAAIGKGLYGVDLKQTEDGRETIVEMAYPGEIFGEEAIFDGQPYPLTAQALSDVELLAITRTDFFTFLRDNPDLALEIITELGARLREAQNTIRALAMERVEWRIARVLLMLSRKAGIVEADGVSIDLPLTRQDIAGILRTLRRYSAKTHSIDVVVTPGEILADEELETSIEAENPDADTKVRTALALSLIPI